ncbi:ArnT family glycosyltransferase [Robiginitalea biformata]|uniref:Dolichyl-phosphate-mannose-protein mannosyltransferase-family protein n=1 Tax=Robiginitalea biformata (strain ATCC BAA-864 / DSM 15991 / KCTC 12146 / HTCC2501) TaxID=313596 RepID=A4CMR7_ROBBH|nr:glycosyltransferase family 39 protein [Robiginitalea biformata]EAR14959.1 dolichyl-phosphate-mannose-protein mannosyltransferase-family protein [Robiginitalea biformata HTCC2501]
MISGKMFWGCFLGMLAVYVCGLPATLMENDSAQFAVMAMRMVQENDFVNLIKGTEQYLDKPHMHYWLAALAYKLFGIHDWAYRLPALLLTLAASRACHGIGKELYNENAGRLAALIFMSAQTIVLSVIDVRTDAVLTGFTALSIWQLLRYLELGSTRGLLWGALTAGLAFSTKGQIALVVIALPLLCHVAYTRRWYRLADLRLVWGLLVFALAISPMLYAYYQQFDLHPEKVIRGRGNRSGILFIFWEQSFERLSGEGVGKNSSDYFFFFHTFLWVFLPWTLMGLAAFGNRAYRMARRFAGNKTAPAPPDAEAPGGAAGENTSGNPGVPEVLTLGGIAIIFLIISFAQFKLPHYLNILIPLFTVLTAGYLDARRKKGHWKWLRRAARLQAGIFGIVLLAVSGIVFWVFPLPGAAAVALVLVLVGSGIALWRQMADPLVRLAVISVLASVGINAVMNAHFYPSLLQYQAGSELARNFVREVPANPPIFKFSEEHTWALDFYSRQPVRIVRGGNRTDLAGRWVYVDEDKRRSLAESGWEWEREIVADQFRITRLQARFVNPETREEVVGKRYLLLLAPAAP